MNFKLGELFCGPGGIAVGALSSRVQDNTGELFLTMIKTLAKHIYDAAS